MDFELDEQHREIQRMVRDFCEREVKPHVPDAWVDESKTKDGYEIPFTRHFYMYTPLRPLADIQADVPAENIMAMWEAVREFGAY